jgi:hypothetical protein
VITIIGTGASIATTQARQMQKNSTLCKKHQVDWANSCPRSSATNVGSTSKHTKKILQAKQIKQSRRDTYATHHVRLLLDKPQIESLGRASDTISGDNNKRERQQQKLPFC